MNSNLSTFQLALMIGLVAILFIGVLIFAGVLPGFRAPQDGAGGTVLVWGTILKETADQILPEFQSNHDSEFTLQYVYKDPRTIESEFVNALAAGRGPDLIIWPHSYILKHRDKLIPIPYEQFAVRDFRDTFLREASLYLFNSGIMGLPLYVDPMVLYYNQDLLTAGRVIAPPKTWSEMQAVVGQLSKIDTRNNISQSAIALGHFSNINNARDIVAMLTLQAGNPIVELGPERPVSVINDARGLARHPALEAIAFFTRFVDPANTLYTWNAAQPEARQAFSRGTLAMYLGYASEHARLRQQNPQLSIEAAVMPQLSSNSAVTIGQMTGISLVRGSPNPATAALVAYYLSSAEFVGPLVARLGLPPMLSELARTRPADPTQSVFYESAIISRGWLDPDPNQSAEVFRTMVESVVSGRERPEQALLRAHDELQILIQ